jgi:molecular chaperone GrpE
VPENRENNSVTERNKRKLNQAAELPDAAAEPVEINGDETPESLVEDELQEMGMALSAAEAELALHRDAMLRMQAEMENLRKRLVRDLEKSRKFALEGLMKDLLQVRDTLERGLQMTAESTSVEALKEGKELTLKMLNKVMADHGLEVVDPLGEAFNPEFHEAVTMVPSADHPENTVIEVLQKGFKLHDRLIRR